MKKQLLLLLCFICSVATAQQKKISIKVTDQQPAFSSIAWLKDGLHIASGCENTNAIIWDVKTGVDVDYFGPHASKVDRVLFTPDYKLMITSCNDLSGDASFISVYNVAERKQITSYKLSNKFSVTKNLSVSNKNMIVSPDGKFLVYMDYFTNCHFIDILNGEEKKSVGAGLGNKKVVITPDSKNLVCIKEDMLFNRNSPNDPKHPSQYNLAFYAIDDDGKEVRSFKAGNSMVDDFIVSPDGHYLAYSYGNGFICIRNLTDKTRDSVIYNSQTSNIKSLFFTPDSKLLKGIAFKEKKIISINIGSTAGNFLSTYINTNDSAGLSNSLFSPDGKYIATSRGRGSDREIIIFNCESGLEFSRFKSHAREMFHAFFGVDGKSVITARYLYDDKSMSDFQKKIDEVNKRFFPGKKPPITLTKKGTDMNIDNKNTFHVSIPPDTRYWDFANGEVYLSIQNAADTAGVKATKSGKFRTAITGDLSKLPGMVTNIMGMSQAEFDSMRTVGNTITYLINDQTKDTFNIYTIDSADWAIVDKRGYFWSSPGAAAGMHYKVGDKIYSFSQFDLQFNRPDIILSEIGLASAAVIKSYKDAVTGRWLEMNVDTSQFNKELNFNIPQLDIILPPAVAFTSPNTPYKLKIKASDKNVYIKSVMVWINGSLLYGASGMDVSAAKSNDLEKELNLTLTPGNNIIEVAVYNSRYIQSYKERLEINYTAPPATKPELFLVAMGVSQYTNTSWNDLKFAAKDAEDVIASFAELDRATDKPFSKFTPFVLTDNNVTEEELVKVKAALMKSKPGDIVIVFYSGHGIRTKKGELVLGTAAIGTAADNYSKGLPYKIINNLMNAIPARQKLVLIDACQSGRINELAYQSSLPGNNKSTASAAKGSDDIPSSKSELTAEKMFNGFINLSGNNGAVVIGATGGDKAAYEEKIYIQGNPVTIQNGVFTYCIMQGIHNAAADANKDAHLDVQELKNYLLETTKALSGTEHKQEAMCTQDNMLHNWQIR